jgi:hypothetical protein
LSSGRRSVAVVNTFLSVLRGLGKVVGPVSDIPGLVRTVSVTIPNLDLISIRGGATGKVETFGVVIPRQAEGRFPITVSKGSVVRWFIKVHRDQIGKGEKIRK